MTTKLRELQTGRFIEPSRLRLGPYLDDWLQVVRGSVRPGTLDLYEMYVRVYLRPRLGDVPLQQLTRTRIRGAYQDLAENGRSRGPGGLSPKTVHNVHLALHRALADAVEDRLLSRNPADGAHRLPRNRPEMRTWSADELRTFLASVANDEFFACWRLLATTGMRRGEVLGLQWKHLDLTRARVAVRRQRVKGDGTVTYGQPKTARGRRNISLDPVTVTCLDNLRLHQMDDNQGGGEDLVFCLHDGSPLHPDGLSQRFERHVRESGLRRLTIHGLRHTYATLALQTGVHPKVVQERLGHSSISVTLDTYSHAVPQMQEEAASQVANLLDQPDPGQSARRR